MCGFNVLHPMGWDAFGLPAENYAIKTSVPPQETTDKSIENFRKQIKALGLSYDWSREVGTHNPDYYRWTQWLFTKFFERGLVYKKKALVNWDPVDQTVLANEQVLPDGTAERSGAKVEKRDLEQWFFKITDYADELADSLDKVDWPESTKINQRNWIGRSEGAELEFRIKNYELGIKVFTTRPDTLFGATYLVVAPEHPLLQEVASNKLQVSNKEEVFKYVNEAKNKSDIDRSAEGKEKTGVELKGVKAINPANKEEIPVWVADYVLGHYGTGAIMAVPAHDERDRQFAEKFNLPIKEMELGDKKKIIEILKEKGLGEAHKNYRLHDWLLSRQRYWGAPIPMIHCAECGYVPVSEDKLPVKLPALDNFMPADDGRSPLAKAEKWLKVKCPECGKPAERETDTMDTFVDSSWYYLSYADPKNKYEFASKPMVANW